MQLLEEGEVIGAASSWIRCSIAWIECVIKIFETKFTSGIPQLIFRVACPSSSLKKEKNYLRESNLYVSFDTFNQIDDETWQDKQKDKYKDNEEAQYIYIAKSNL